MAIYVRLSKTGKNLVVYDTATQSHWIAPVEDVKKLLDGEKNEVPLVELKNRRRTGRRGAITSTPNGFKVSTKEDKMMSSAELAAALTGDRVRIPPQTTKSGGQGAQEPERRVRVIIGAEYVYFDPPLQQPELNGKKINVSMAAEDKKTGRIVGVPRWYAKKRGIIPG